MNKLINYIKHYIKVIILMIFIVFWIVLYLKGYITLYRIYVFIFILIVIFLYQKVINFIDKKDITLNENLVYVLLYIDNIKLLGFNIINYIYILLYNLKFDYNCKKIADILTYIYEYMLVFPFYFIMHKYYTVLKIWKETPYKNLILNRFYGVILSVLIFSPLILLIWNILNKNWIYIYILLVIIIYIHENLQYIYMYKYVSVLTHIRILNICVESSYIFMYRNKVSILVILIRKRIGQINNYYSKLDKFAFNINHVYLVMMDVSLKYGNIQKPTDTDFIKFCLQTNREVYSFKNKIFFSKLVVIRKTIINTDKHLFNTILFNYEFCLNFLYNILSIIIYSCLNYNKFKLDLNKLNQLERFFVNITKLLMFYIWDLQYQIYSISDIKLMFKVNLETSVYPKLELDTSWLFNKENIQKLNNIINQKDVKIYKSYYEQVYLYSNIINLYLLKNHGIDCKNYPHIYKYVEVILSNLSVLNIKNNSEYWWYDLKKFKYINIESILSYPYKNGDLQNTEMILEKELNKYRENFIKEWENSIKDVKFNKKIFYKRNNLRLKEFSDQILNEIKNKN